MTGKKVCIIGLGYVGLTLGAVLCDRKFTVFGVEQNETIVEKLKKEKKAHFFEKNLDKLLAKQIDNGLYVFNKIPENEFFDYYIITVGTPIDKITKKPNSEYIKEALQQIAHSLKGGETVILRSTVAIGTTRDIAYPILKNSGKEFYLAFCPERTAEGVALRELRELPQIIGGIDEDSIKKAVEIFRKITPTTIEVSTLEDAEMNKMVDNIYRDLNFACANEIALMARQLGLDGNDLIRAGNLGYPRTHIPVPGFVGGACLEKDPWILIDSVMERTGYMPKLMKTAREINEALPLYVADVVEGEIKKRTVDITTCKIFISGFAFKGRPLTDDLRGSSTLGLLKALKEKGFTYIYGHDFLVQPQEIQKLGVRYVLPEEGFADADAVIIMNNHPGYEDLDIEKLILKMKKGGLFFDGWHIYDPRTIRELNHVSYQGIGVRS